MTELKSNDNKKITIPNSSILNNPVTNFGARPVRRVDFNFEVAYESDVELCSLINITENVAIYENGQLKLIKD